MKEFSQCENTCTLCGNATSASSCEKVEYKDVVVIGNGPSAITLSYFLAGNWPYFDCNSTHPIEYLNHKLSQAGSKSLIEQDLEYLCEGLEGRSNNPVSVLFDILNNPEADLGIESLSCLNWSNCADKSIDHVVIGKGAPGGAWQNMDGSMLTISLSSWMELPNFSFKEWELKRSCTNGTRQSRATVRYVAQYYEDYIQANGLCKHFKNNSTVTSIRRLPEHNSCWEVKGMSALNDSTFTYITPSVVLATGTFDVPNKLSVPGEELPFVLHSLSSLEQLIKVKKLNPTSDTLLIVGAGLTAADAIIAAHFYGIRVAHVFRRDVNDQSLVFNNLPENMYPEYHKVHQMMRGKGIGYRGYCPYEKHQIVRIQPDRKVQFRGPEGSVVLPVSYVLILIGSKPELSFLPENGVGLGREVSQPIECRRNPILCEAFTHQSVYEKGLFALGPLVGDNFVRFLQGGALAIANHLHRQSQRQVELTTTTTTRESGGDNNDCDE